MWLQSVKNICNHGESSIRVLPLPPRLSAGSFSVLAFTALQLHLVLIMLVSLGEVKGVTEKTLLRSGSIFIYIYMDQCTIAFCHQLLFTYLEIYIS